ncbi:MAG: hypothetical protein LBK65_07225 [Tannerellaceae bacterium]|nr:hypothetical protein [Tannerellaceae bacterium]
MSAAGAHGCIPACAARLTFPVGAYAFSMGRIIEYARRFARYTASATAYAFTGTIETGGGVEQKYISAVLLS